MTTTALPAGQHRGVRRFVRRHPHLTFLLVFNTLGQASAFVPVIAARVYGVQLDTDLFLIIPTLLFLLLPALVITHIARGEVGLRELVGSTLRFRVQAWWYLLPLLAVPALTVLASAPIPDLTVQKVLAAYVTVYLPALLFQFLTTNWWEETVWTGFFQAPLQRRFGPWRAVLLTTPWFALQHLSLVFGGTLGQGLAQFALIVLVIIPTRALMSWIYHRTGSLALAGLVHAASNAAGIGLVPALTQQPGGGGAALLLLGVVLVVATRGRLGHPRPTLDAGPATAASQRERPHG